MSKERNLDMFALLRAVDRREANWLAQQSEAANKDFAPVVAMRWATGVRDGTEAAYMLWIINKLVNHRLFDLYLDKDLSFRLLASCGLGQGLRREWVPLPRQTSHNAAYRLLAAHHPTANDAELTMLLSLYTRDEFVQFVNDCGMDKDATKTYLQAYDKVSTA